MDKTSAKEENVLKPSPALLIKLGSIIVHFEEYTSTKGNPVDLTAAKSLLESEDVKAWMTGMETMAFLPLKR